MSVFINGEMYEGSSITMINGRVIVDGIEVKNDSSKNAVIEVKGDVQDLNCQSCVIHGDVKGDVDANNVVCRDVHGDIDANNVTCNRRG